MSDSVISPDAAMTSQEVSEWTKKLNYGTWRYQKSWNPLHIVDAEALRDRQQQRKRNGSARYKQWRHKHPDEQQHHENHADRDRGYQLDALITRVVLVVRKRRGTGDISLDPRGRGRSRHDVPDSLDRFVPLRRT